MVILTMISKNMGSGKLEIEEEEDERREAAIASSPSLQPNFKPAGVSQTQLDKFQELHRRRLQIKAKSKSQKKPKGTSKNLGKSHQNNSGHDSQRYKNLQTAEGLSESKSTRNCVEGYSSMQQENALTAPAPKKRQKLHWGLDTKERWEMKANM